MYLLCVKVDDKHITYFGILFPNDTVMSKALVVSMSKRLYPHCLQLVGSRDGLESDFSIELN